MEKNDFEKIHFCAQLSPGNKICDFDLVFNPLLNVSVEYSSDYNKLVLGDGI